MEIVNSDDIAWDKLFLQHEYIIVNYHTEIQFPGYNKINKIFGYLSEESEFNKIKFLRIDSHNNPVAEEFLENRKLPFVGTFKGGFLIECNSIESEKSLRDMLIRLLNFKIKL
ncbi:MAG: hypothetical protein JWO32_1994 [Bacteroidetes bacterium]|nr:hypothetical protein [Bacteroidota bacterium]